MVGYRNDIVGRVSVRLISELNYFLESWKGARISKAGWRPREIEVGQQRGMEEE